MSELSLLCLSLYQSVTIMFKWQSAIPKGCSKAIAGLTSLGLLAGITPAQAATLFDGSALNSGQVLTWTSPFKGTVKVKAEVTTNTQTGSSETRYEDTIEVDWGTEIFLEAIISEQNQDFDPDFLTDIQAEISVDPGLLFLGTQEDLYNRVVLVTEGDDKVYESSFLGGVQKQYTLNSIFESHGEGGKPLFVAREYWEIDPEIAQDMAAFIDTQIGKEYADINEELFLNPDKQKGLGNPSEFTSQGLIERAAEVAGVNSGQGYIPNHLEAIFINEFQIDQFLTQTPWECLITYPVTNPECIEDRNRNRDPNSSSPTPKLSTNFLHYASTSGVNLFGDSLLQGKLNNIDFLLTDPEGRRLGFVEGRGLFEEIPNSYYSGNQLVEDFSIPELIPGEYKLEFFGLYNEEAYAVIGDRENGVLIGFNEEYKKNNPDPPPFILPIPVTPRQDVPENQVQF